MLPVTLCMILAKVALRTFAKHCLVEGVEQMQEPTTGAPLLNGTIADDLADGSGFDGWWLLE